MSVSEDHLACSKVLISAVDELVLPGTDHVLPFVEDLATKVAVRYCAPAVCWVKVFMYGSCALGAAIAGSDVDLYGETFLYIVFFKNLCVFVAAPAWGRLVCR